MRNILIAFILLNIGLGSCKKFVTIDPPITKLISSTVFTSDASANAAVRGIYATMAQSGSGFAQGGTLSITFLTSLSSDELTSYSTNQSNIEFYRNSLKASNSYLSNLWDQPFKIIYAINSVLEALGKTTTVSDTLKSQLRGEMLFVRAFCNFYLVNLFGDIPMILTTDYRVNTNASRITKEIVYKQIITDLSEAATLLSKDYLYSEGERVRPNAAAAQAMLARVYLYTEDWIKAEQYASLLIGNKPRYDLVALNNVFLKNSQEAIWQILPISGGQTGDGTNFILTATPSTAPSNSTSISSWLLNTFEPGDKRKTSWIGSFTTTSPQPITYYFPFKYKTKQGSVQSEYSTILRLSEMYLIRAEARIQQNAISEGISDINVIRARARDLPGPGIPNPLPPLISTLDKDAALLAVEHERQVELFTEWGHRWLDLKRTNRANTIMPSVTAAKQGEWQSEWQLYPIPQAQISNDPAMKDAQNTGYN